MINASREISPLGESLLPVLAVVAARAERHMDDLGAARAADDRVV